ncbi:MAG: ABC transporter ATP-binding protein [Actinomycetota bacterium]
MGAGADREQALRRAGWRLVAAASRDHWGWVASAMVAALLWTATKVAIPLLAAAAIDQGIVGDDTGALLVYVGLMLVLGAFQAFVSGTRRYGAFRLAFHVETDLRGRLFAHLQRLHFAFHDQAQTGQLMARANTDIQMVREWLMLAPLTAASLMILVSVFVVMLFQSVVLALLALAALPVLSVAAIRFSRRMGPISFELQQELAELSGVVEETVSGVRVVKGFGAEALQVRRLEAEADAVRDRALAASRLRAGFLPLVDFLPAIALVMILWYGGHLVIDGQMQIGQLVAFNSYILMLIWPLRMSGMMVAMSSRMSASAGRVHEVLDTDPHIADSSRGRPLPEGGGEVRFERVSFGYHDGAAVLDGIDLHVRAGEAVALVGPTASGKSTVARLLPRFYDVDDGRVLIDGADVRTLRLSTLRNSVGIVFEETFLFSDTVRANIAFADPDAPLDQVRRAAALAGAADFIDDLPDGYDTVIGEHGFSLSGGQRQRIAIARAVLADPRVLILDDATSAVDPSKEHEIRAALREVMAGRTTIIIAHRPATIALADRVILIDEGKVVAEGTHEHLVATSDRYRDVLAHADPHPTGAGRP